MKKFVALALIVACLCGATASAQAGGESLDLVVLLDDSASMFPHFEKVKEFIVSFIIRDYLRSGDSFNLILFSDKARIEAAESMVPGLEPKGLLARIYMILPFGKHSDIPQALQFTYEYTASLSEARRAKTIIIISDGIHNPPSDSASYGKDEDTLASETQATIERMRGKGWKVRFIKIPFELPPSLAGAGSEASGPGAADLSGGLAGAVEGGAVEFSPDDPESSIRQTMGAPIARLPGDLGDREREFSFPLFIENPTDQPIALELDGVIALGQNILRQKAFLSLAPRDTREMTVSVAIPGSVAAGAQKLDIALTFANGVRVTPGGGQLVFNLVSNPFGGFLKGTGTVIIFVVLFVVLAAAVLIVIFTLRKSRRKGSRIAAESGAREAEAAAWLRDQDRGASPGPGPSAAEGREAGSKAPLPRPLAASAGDPAGTTGFGRVSKEEEALEAGRAASLDDFSRAVRGDESARSGDRLLKQFAQGPDMEGKDLLARYAARDAAAKDDPIAAFVRRGDSDADSLAAFAKRQKAEEEALFSLPLAKKAAPKAVQETVATDYSVAVKKEGKLLIEFRVADQNPKIGMRNVHFVASGGRKSIGGGASDFLVYFVEVSAKIAEFQYDGERLWIVPVRKEFFPELAGPKEIAFGEGIAAVTKKGYRFSFCVRPYEKPAERINRILHFVEVPKQD